MQMTKANVPKTAVCRLASNIGLDIIIFYIFIGCVRNLEAV